MLNPHCLRLLVGTLSAGKSQKDRKDPLAGERGMRPSGREGVEHMGLERGELLGVGRCKQVAGQKEGRYNQNSGYEKAIWEPTIL